MTNKAKKIVESMNMIIVDKQDFQTINKDRLDFGFDSIYFRYAEVCDELALYKAIVEHSNPLDEKERMRHKKMHFYTALEQLVRAHEERKSDTN